MASNRDLLADRRLDSWKEIATFFGRGERTVKRWEVERGLPVHRLPGSGRGSVFAYASELANWLEGKNQELEAEETSGATSVRPPDAAEITDGERIPAQDVKPEAYSDRGETSPVTSVSARSHRAQTAGLVLFAIFGLVIAWVSFGSRRFHLRALETRHVPSVEAQDLYLRGRYFWDRRTPDDLNKAVDYFTQAIVKDPGYSQAYVGLADCYNLLREFGAMSPREAWPRALSAAQRAVQLDDSSAEAHISLAFVTYWWSWRGASAEREFQRALALDPKLVRAHHWYATYLYGRRRYPEALDQMEQARRLEPSSTAILADKGMLLWDSGQRAEALSLLTQLEATEPDFSSTHDYLSRIYWREKDYAKYLMESRRAVELRHDQAGIALADAREKGFKANGVEGLLESELPLQKKLVDTGEGSAYGLASTYAALGRSQDAFACLQTSFDRHEAPMLAGDPIPELQGSAEFQKFRTRVNQLMAQ